MKVCNRYEQFIIDESEFVENRIIIKRWKTHQVVSSFI